MGEDNGGEDVKIGCKREIQRRGGDAREREGEKKTR